MDACPHGAYGHCPMHLANGAVYIDRDGVRRQMNPSNCTKYEDAGMCAFAAVRVEGCKCEVCKNV
jgi:hypothetical protein